MGTAAGTGSMTSGEPAGSPEWEPVVPGPGKVIPVESPSPGSGSGSPGLIRSSGGNLDIGYLLPSGFVAVELGGDLGQVARQLRVDQVAVAGAAAVYLGRLGAQPADR